MSKTTYVLVQTEPRPWLSLLYAKAIDLQLAHATAIHIASKGVGTLTTSTALTAVEARSRVLGQDGAALIGPCDEANVEVFRTAVLETKSAKLINGSGTLFESQNSGFVLRLSLDESQTREMRNWVEEHGDDFDVIFRESKRVKQKVHPIGVRLKPGQSLSISAAEVPEELRSGILDLQSVKLDVDRLTVTGRGRRLIPNSGWLGRMGRYDITLVIEKVTAYDIDDERQLRAVPVTVGHFDPAEGSLIIGMPAAGWLQVSTKADRYKISIAEQPVQVRRWKRWQTV